MLSIGLLVLLNWIAPKFGGVWGGSIVLAGIGVSFLAVYLVERQNWWALIPAGSLASLLSSQKDQIAQFNLSLRQYRDTLRNLGMGPLQVQRLIDSRQATENVEITSPADGIIAYPGVVNLIKKIHDSRTPLAISSGALRSDIEPILETLGITNCFDVIVTAEDVAKSKPDPESYQLAYTRLNTFHSRNLPAQKVLAIEDTPADIAAAKGAGLGSRRVSEGKGHKPPSKWPY